MTEVVHQYRRRQWGRTSEDGLHLSSHNPPRSSISPWSPNPTIGLCVSRHSINDTNETHQKQTYLAMIGTALERFSSRQPQPSSPPHFSSSPPHPFSSSPHLLRPFLPGEPLFRPVDLALAQGHSPSKIFLRVSLIERHFIPKSASELPKPPVIFCFSAIPSSAYLAGPVQIVLLRSLASSPSSARLELALSGVVGVSCFVGFTTILSFCRSVPVSFGMIIDTSTWGNFALIGSVDTWIGTCDPPFS